MPAPFDLEQQRNRALEALLRAAAGIEPDEVLEPERLRALAASYQLLFEDQGRMAWVCTRGHPGGDLVLAGLALIVSATSTGITFETKVRMPTADDQARLRSELEVAPQEQTEAELLAIFRRAPLQ